MEDADVFQLFADGIKIDGDKISFEHALLE